MEIIFLVMIAVINFQVIENNYKQFNDEKIHSLKTLGNELLINPVSVYDTDTIDNRLDALNKLENVESIKVWNNDNVLLSKVGDDSNKGKYIKELSQEIIVDDMTIGRFTILLNTENIRTYIYNNKQITLVLIFMEIIISIFLSWIIGYRIAKSLNTLKDYAENLSQNLNTPIPQVNDSKEIMVLSETLERMRQEIVEDRYSLNRYKDMIEDNIIITRTNLKGELTYVSNAFCIISGYTKGELIGKNQNIVRHPDSSSETFKNLWKTIQAGYTWNGELKNLKKDGGYYWIEATISPWVDINGDTIGYIGIRHDITDKKKVEELSITDKLTQLYNRVKLEEIFTIELERVKRYHHDFSVIMLDIDHFKSVNDTHGHNVGDDVLKDVAEILKSSIRATDFVGRWGGEEFIIITLETGKKDTVKLANLIRKNMENHIFNVIGSKTASFGVSSYQDGDTQESLIKRADDALYEAKNTGRNKVVSL